MFENFFVPTTFDDNGKNFVLKVVSETFELPIFDNFFNII